MKLQSRLLLLFALVFSVSISSDSTLSASKFNQPIQVLIQGEDPEKLRQALQDLGGLITHDLPIVSGVGGIIEATELASLADTKGVDRVTEDFNPPKLPETREDRKSVV